MKIVHVAFCLSLLAQLCSCEKFGTLRGVREKDFGEALLQQLEETLSGSKHSQETEQNLVEIEDELRPLFVALPKNNRNALEGAYARYALHRFFAGRYGWQVKGLEMGSTGWDVKSGAVDVMGDRLPPRMRKLFFARLESHGFELRDLAVLAAVLDSMFRSDVHDRLHVVYDFLEHRPTDVLNESQASEVAQTYLATLIIGKPIEELDLQDVRISQSTWVQFGRRDHVEDTLQKATEEAANKYDFQKFDWEAMTASLFTFGKKLGHSENQECQNMKSSLVRQETSKGSGLVRYSDFYKTGANFEETLGELRSMRALDETNPNEPKVIIPNYVMGATNCISPAGFYSICCLDECEELMSKIEHHFAAPAASPKALAFFVANGSLAPDLLQTLEALAMDNGGMVPFYDNKFANWLHHVFPRECPDPRQTDRFDSSLRYVMQDAKEGVASALQARATSVSTHERSNSRSLEQASQAKTQRDRKSVV